MNNNVARDKSPLSSLKATLGLLCFAFATIIGYVVFEATLREFISPQLLTLNTFFWLFLYNVIGPRDFALMWTWRPSISIFVVQYSLSWFAYWYAFWVGLSAGDAPMALAILALTMVVNPAVLGRLPPKEHREPMSRIFIVGGVLILAVLLIKLDMPVATLFDLRVVLRRFEDTSVFAVICMLIAVCAEAVQDRAAYSLSRNLDSNFDTLRSEYQSALDENIDAIELELSKNPQKGRRAFEVEVVQDRANLELLMKSLPIVLVLSTIMMVLHGQWGFPRDAHALEHWGWLAGCLLVLGMTGAIAKPVFVTPLQGAGLDPESIPPMMAGRQVLFYLAVWAAMTYLPSIHWQYFACTDRTPESLICWTYPFNRVHLELPQGNQTYWIGVSIALAIWIIAWIRLWRIGFFRKTVAT